MSKFEPKSPEGSVPNGQCYIGGLSVNLNHLIKPVRKNSFGVRIVNIWNNLPENVVNSPNVNTFKNRLDKHWENQEILFNYRAELKINV